VARATSELFLRKVLEVDIMLFCWKLILSTSERISKYPTGEFRARAITFPIKE
jgi:hypothetical protein